MKCILLTQGQGAQSVLMGRDFYDAFSVFRQTMEEAEDLAQLPIRRWIFEGTAESLKRTDQSQLAIYSTTVAIYRVLKEAYPEITFEAGIGLSLGEYSVLTIANALDFQNGIHLVKRRGELMQEASTRHPGTMAAVLGLTKGQIEPNLVGSAVLANLNTHLQSVISGKKEDIDLTTENLKKAGAKRVIVLDVQGAFHSSLMQEAYQEFKAIVDSTPFTAPLFPIVMNATAQFATDPMLIKELLSQQLISSVRFQESIELVSNKLPFLELGPGSVVKGLVQKNIDAQVFSVNAVKDLREVTSCVY